MSLRDTPAVNIAKLRDWHQQHHLSPSWAQCPHEPCNCTTPTFRRQWDTGAN